jgi:hypothetical protein
MVGELWVLFPMELFFSHNLALTAYDILRQIKTQQALIKG